MPDISRYVSIDSTSLEKIGLPSNVLTVLEGDPVHPPEYPDVTSTDDTRIIAGGLTTSQNLRKQYDHLANNLEALAEQTSRNTETVQSNAVALEGLSTLLNTINMIQNSINTVTGSSVLIDFYQNSPTVLNTSIVNIDTLYGQVTLPYISSPESQILRPGHTSARPGTLVEYAIIPKAQSTLSDVSFNSSDSTVFRAVDSRLDTAWNVQVDDKDLLVKVTLSPTLGRNAFINSIGIVPWPVFGASIIDVYIKTSEPTSLKGYQKVLLKGQLTYNSSSDIIETAGCHRLFFSGKPVTDILVRLRPKSGNKVGLINFNCWSVLFDNVGSLKLDTSTVGISSISNVTLAGLDTNVLSRLNTYTNGSQLTIEFNTASMYESPVLTSIGLKEHVAGSELTGFDIDVFAN